MKKIHVNQLGYKPDGIKKAILTNDENNFEIFCAKKNFCVFSNACEEKIFDAASGTNVRVADFSEFREQGEFFIRANGEDSYTFAINENPYAGLREALLEMFNFQKCGMAIDCGIWSHPACHDSLATIYGTNEKIDVTGGWHDAGDYGRYVVPAAVTLADLLLAHEFSSQQNENLLEVAWFEIKWLLKMQCKKTGGVFHKVTCKDFNALDELPHDEKNELVVSPISLTATADFAAIIAMASRFFPAEKNLLIAAATRAWEFCEEILRDEATQNEHFAFSSTQNENTSQQKTNAQKNANEHFAFSSTQNENISQQKTDAQKNANEPFAFSQQQRENLRAGFRNPPEIHTGWYGDKEFRDELFWAACELFSATGDEKFHDFVKASEIYIGLGWANVGTYGIAAYLRGARRASGFAENEKKFCDDVLRKMQTKLRDECERIMQNFSREPYGTSLNGYFRWGSNYDVANNAMHLLIFSRAVEKNQACENAAAEHIHYILGRNPLSVSYVTGFGTNAFKNPHLRTTVPVGEAFPGLVSGGPNMHPSGDAAWKNFCEGKPPSMCYVDDALSYSTNEITIYWNSAVYFAVSVLGM
ncbi:MAG: glycoside hydrolase family 9 protein [Defluviitaleaceae bacterium]|nr:glycoside hydrolase family 9 protein [Defluviitaleaceae bacterium]